MKEIKKSGSNLVYVPPLFLLTPLRLKGRDGHCESNIAREPDPFAPAAGW